MTKVMLREENLVGADLSAWLAGNGGKGLESALEQSADSVIEMVEESDLRGMGGAGYLTFRKLQALRQSEGKKKYLVCNGNEDEPGTFKDRYLLAKTPHQVIEGALIAARATGAHDLVFYLNPHQEDVLPAVREALQQWREHPLLSRLEKIVGKPLSMRVVESSGLYIGGEETAAISTIEGSFPFPRAKPPFPAQSGIHGHPTGVQNVETLAQLPALVARGPDWYRSLGLGAASGTKIYSLSGDVLKPGVYELPLGTILRDLVFLHGKGLLADKKFKAVFTGGPSNTLLTENDLDVPLDWDSLKARRSRLGTGAMIVVSEGASIVKRVSDYVDFFAQASCGQCPSCKIGTRQIAQLLDRLDRGRGTQRELHSLKNLCQLLPGSGRCGLVDGAVTVVKSSMDKFRDEYEELAR